MGGVSAEWIQTCAKIETSMCFGTLSILVNEQAEL